MQYNIRIIADSVDGKQHNETHLPIVEAANIYAALGMVMTKNTETGIEMHERLVETQNAAVNPIKSASDSAND